MECRKCPFSDFKSFFTFNNVCSLLKCETSKKYSDCKCINDDGSINNNEVEKMKQIRGKRKKGEIVKVQLYDGINDKLIIQEGRVSIVYLNGTCCVCGINGQEWIYDFSKEVLDKFNIKKL